MSETTNYRRAAKKLTIDDLFISDWQKEIRGTELQAKIVQCVVLVIAFLLLMAFGPGQWR